MCRNEIHSVKYIFNLFFVFNFSEDIEFVFYGNTNSKFNCIAACEVEGGPEYTLTLAGEASTVSYALNCSFLDFGKIVYTEFCEKELVLTNNGRVPFVFSFIKDQFSTPGLIEINPETGKIQANENLTIVLRFRPGIPNVFAEKLGLSVAHFDPATITCYAKGKFLSASKNMFYWSSLCISGSIC